MKKRIIALMLVVVLFTMVGRTEIVKASYDWVLQQTSIISGSYGTAHYMSTYKMYIGASMDENWKVSTTHYGAMPYIMYGYSVMQYLSGNTIVYTTGRQPAVSVGSNYISTAVLDDDGSDYFAQAYCGIDY